MTIDIRRATHDDYEAVVDLTSGIWTDRGGDYLPDVYHDWLEEEGDETKRTFLAEVDGVVVGIVQAVMLSPTEAWFQGMRVHPEYRRRGVSSRLNDATFEWARERGATVGRIVVFSWNTAALGLTRATGFDPLTEFRWAHVEPDADPELAPSTETDGSALEVSSDPSAAWEYVTTSEANTHLRGLALAPEQLWALRELTRDDLEGLPVFAIGLTGHEDDVRGMSYRVREFERTTDDGETRTCAEYGVAAWDDIEAARTLFAAIARDAAERGAAETRVLIPETAETVSDAVYAGADVADEPDFVLGIDLSRHSV